MAAPGRPTSDRTLAPSSSGGIAPPPAVGASAPATLDAAAVQTAWADLVIATLVDCGVREIIVSPGSRSTPLVAALAKLGVATRVVIDERAAAFVALGAARATGLPAAAICTSGTAAAHYLPAVVEASVAGVPMLVVTADRPAELQACGAAQTIDQVKMYGGFVRGAFDLGAPATGELALRAVRRKVIQAVTLARGPHPGPVHLEVPLRKPLEPVAYDAAILDALRTPVAIAPPRLAADPAAIDALAAAIRATPDGVIVAGALPATFAGRAAIARLAAATGYPVLAEAGSQLRFGGAADVARDRVAADVARDRAAADVGADLAAHAIDAIDVIPVERRPRPALVIHVGGEPVAASWAKWTALADAERWVIADAAWQDADSAARAVIAGDPAATLEILAAKVPRRASTWLATWRTLDTAARAAVARALAAHPDSEAAAIATAVAALPTGAQLQLGNSLPIRVVDQVAARGSSAHAVITQRGAAGIDGTLASAAGAALATGRPTLLLVGDVTFAHDVGALIVARELVSAPLVIVVLDNAGGQIFSGLPIARTASAATLARYFTTAPGLDPVAIARAFGVRADRYTPAAPDLGDAVARALATPGPTVLHVVCTASGAHDVRRTALEEGLS